MTDTTTPLTEADKILAECAGEPEAEERLATLCDRLERELAAATLSLSEGNADRDFYRENANRFKAERDAALVVVEQHKKTLDMLYGRPFSERCYTALIAKLDVEKAYAELLVETLEGVHEAIAKGLKFDGAKWLLFESGRDALLDRISAALAKREYEIGTGIDPADIGPITVAGVITKELERESAVGHLSPSEFAIYDGDEFFSEVSGPREQAWGEAMHYAMQCDKPRIEEIVRTPAPMGEVPPGALFPESSQDSIRTDATRYRWLRAGHPGCYNKVMIHAGEALDRAVDDAIEQTSPSELDIDPQTHPSYSGHAQGTGNER